MLQPLFDEETEYFKWITEQRKAKQLHTTVENRLVAVARHTLPEYLPVKEPQGLAGGRNDLLLFDYRGRKVLFEIFASQSQVSRDLRILDKTNAAVKLSIVIDREVDARVWDRIQKENPENNYPFIFIKELFVTHLLQQSFLKLRHLVAGDEDDIRAKSVSLRKVFNLVVVRRLQKLGMQPSKLRKLVEWLSNEEMGRFVFLKLGLGFNLLLFTDLDEEMEILSDLELLDWLPGCHVIDSPVVLLSVNNIIVDLLSNCFPGLAPEDYGKKIRFTVGRSEIIDDDAGRQVSFSIPRNTKRISLFRPWGFAGTEPLTKDEVMAMIDLF
jgi:hypothetical protein